MTKRILLLSAAAWFLFGCLVAPSLYAAESNSRNERVFFAPSKAITGELGKEAVLAADGVGKMFRKPTPISSVVGARADEQIGSGAKTGARSPFNRSTAGRGVAETGGTYKALGISLFVVSAGDLLSTEYGLQKPGMEERNPLQVNRGVRFATHIAAPLLVHWATNRLQRDGHGKMAFWLRLGFNAVLSYAVMHNVRAAGL